MTQRSLTQTKSSFTPIQTGLLQRKCASCGQHTIASGECTECAKKKSDLQRKLTIGVSNDPLEQEADRVADQVLAAPTHSAVSSAPLRIQRHTGQMTEGMDTAPASVDRVLSSPGRPLDPSLQQDMGQRFGHDFSRVRVHTDAAAERSAQDVNAHAYTAGYNIVFGASRFAPGTHDGRRLLAHELTHVVQQSEGATALQRQPSPAADPSVEPAATPISLDEQLDAQMDAEDDLRLEWGKRKDKNYAWSLGRKDKVRIRKNWKLSPKLKQEITVKVRFFEGEAKAAYIRTIGPALEEFPEEVADILAPPPSEEKPCPIGQTILVYQGKPGQGRCITENDTEFRQNYIDNYIDRVDPMAIPNTTWGNVNHDRIPQIQLTYKNGRTLVVNVEDIPRGESSRNLKTTAGTTTPLAKYEKRSDGFIYPIRSTGNSDYVSYGDAANIMSLRAGLYDRIEELKLNFQILEVGAAFLQNIAALGGFASMNHPGGLFQRVPKKKTTTGTGEPPVPKTALSPDSKPEPKPVPAPTSYPLHQGGGQGNGKPIGMLRVTDKASRGVKVDASHPIFKDKPPANDHTSTPPQAEAAKAELARTGTDNAAPALVVDEAHGATPSGQGAATTRMGKPPLPPGPKPPSEPMYVKPVDEVLPPGTHKVTNTPNPRSSTTTRTQRIRAELKKEGIEVSDNASVHHIVEENGGGPLGDRARDLLAEAGLGIHDGPNLVPLPYKGRGDQGGISRTPTDALVSHDEMHTEKYLETLVERLEMTAPEKRAGALRDIRRQILNDEFPHHPKKR